MAGMGSQVEGGWREGSWRVGSRTRTSSPDHGGRKVVGLFVRGHLCT